MQDRRVDVLHVEAIDDGGSAPIRPSRHALAAEDATAGQPHGEAIRIVVSPCPRLVLGCRLPSEFASPDDERSFQEAAAARSWSRPAIGLSVSPACSS